MNEEDFFGLQPQQNTTSKRFFLNADPFQAAQEELAMQTQQDPWLGTAQALQGTAPIQGDDWKTALANALLGFGKGFTKGRAQSNLANNKEKIYAGLSGALSGDRSQLDAFPQVQGAYDGYLELIRQQQEQIKQKQLGEMQRELFKNNLDLNKNKELKQFDFDLNQPLKQQEIQEKGNHEKIRLSDNLRAELSNTPEFKNYSEIKTNMDAMREIAKQDDRAGDLALVYQLAKILDPGSVVRENEIKLASGTNSPLFQWNNDLKSLAFGTGRLSPETRSQLLAAAGQKQLAANKAYETIFNPRMELAKKRGLDIEDVVTLKPLSFGIQSGGQGTIEIGPDGKKYRVID